MTGSGDAKVLKFRRKYLDFLSDQILALQKLLKFLAKYQDFDVRGRSGSGKECKSIEIPLEIFRFLIGLDVGTSKTSVIL